MNLELKGKKVLITGGSVGIGLAVAKKFAEEGADIAIGARNIDRVKTVVTEIKEITFNE
jgi:3-oxoacyl-[acyl-carrier protein] reductase